MYETIEVGRRCVVEHTFTQAQFDAFAELSGDDNPIHVDEAFAATTRFGKTLCHGMLLFGTVARVLRREFLGPDVIIVDQALKFPGPTFANDTTRISLEVVAVEGRRATVAATISKPDGVVCLEGTTEVTL